MIPRLLKEEIARKAREKAKMIMEGPDAERVRKRFADGNWPAFPNFDEAIGVTNMPERYSEKARRSIFFARYEAGQSGSPVVGTEHLLLCVLREGKAHLDRFLLSTNASEAIRKRIEEHSTVRENAALDVKLPFSNESERVLANAADEALKLGAELVGLEHLLLGMLREEDSLPAELLREHGVEAARLKQH